MTTIKTTQVTCNNCGSDSYEEIARTKDFEYETCENEFIFVRCTSCGLVYLQNRPCTSELSIIYPSDYIPYHFNEYLGSLIASLRNFVQKRKIKAIAHYAQPECTIIDVGCGSGELLRIAQKFGDTSWRLIGVDFAEEAMINLKRFNIEGQRGRFETMNWEESLLPQVIVMNQVIEHLDNPFQVVARAFELLQPEGVLVIETPSIEGWDAQLFQKRYWGGWHTPRHWNLYDQNTLEFLLRKNGFEIVETTYLLSPNFWLQSLHHLIVERLAMPRLARFFDVSFLPALAIATVGDYIQKTLRKRTSNFRMVGRKPKFN
jgi:2-polyprenyl-3-methyl-5-hydroxy-6-metoxy-1,4-benzoquinol methylase